MGREVPKHIGIIMDGNGRWAKKRFLPRVMGHRQGAQALDKLTILLFMPFLQRIGKEAKMKLTVLWVF